MHCVISLKGSQSATPQKKNIMKIGILTLPLHSNYGGVLQAYALQTVLTRMGHEVEIFNKNKPHSRHRNIEMPFVFFVRFVKKYLFRKKTDVFAENKALQERIAISKNIIPFIDKHMKVVNVDRLSKTFAKDYDAIIVGSDQIWRKNYFIYWWPNFEDAFLRFTKDLNIKRIAYAPSFGVDDWRLNSIETMKVSTLLKSFDAISVRECSAVELCRRYLNVEAQHVLDPTMLLDFSNYLLNIDCSKYINSNTSTIMSYVLDENENSIRLIESASSLMGLQINKTNVQCENNNIPVEDRIQPALENWLSSFVDAEYVITDSFHACVFSILSHTPFIVVGNTKRGNSRFSSLLSCFHLQSRICDVRDIDHCMQILNTPIDWNAIESILTEQRKISFDYLNRALSNT